MFGYRSWKYPVTAKALRKLEAAERAAGIVFGAADDQAPSVRPAEPVTNPKESAASADQFPEAGKMMDDRMERMERQIERLLAVVSDQAATIRAMAER